MAVITPDTFDPLRRYVGVRLQQGVPIVDADENEREDIRRFELRAFLKWFVGDGVPEGNDGFRVEALPPATASATDFMIRAGGLAAPAGADNVEKGLTYVGRCLVDGYDVIIEDDIRFTQQPLHASQPGAAALAAAYGVPPVSPLDSGGEVTVYLDVWHRLVTPTEDPSLVHPGLGTESCSRHRREWVVRVRPGYGAPAHGEADYLDGHSYYALAHISRDAPAIRADSISDLREGRLLVPPANIVTDAFGTHPLDYRRGAGRPAVSLRESINAVLNGRLPGGPEIELGGLGHIGSYLDRNAWVYDGRYLMVVWNTYMGQLYLTQLDLQNPHLGASPSVPITVGPKTHSSPSVIRLGNGELLVVYQDAYDANSQTRVLYKRAAFENLAAAHEHRVNPNSTELEISPQVYLTGNIVTIFFYNNNTMRWRYRRFSAADMSPIDNAPVQLGDDPMLNQMHMIRDHTGQKLIFANINGNPQDRVVAGEFDPATGTVQSVVQALADGSPLEPFLIRNPSTGEVLVFYSLHGGSLGIRVFSRIFQNQGYPNIVVPNTTGTEYFPGGERQPYAMAMGSDLWLFFNRGYPGTRINCVRLDSDGKNWLGPYSLSSQGAGFISAFRDPSINTRFWALYGSSGKLYARQIFTEI